MTTKTIFITSLVPALFTGIGTYELMRDKGTSTLNTLEKETHRESETAEEKEHKTDSSPEQGAASSASSPENSADNKAQAPQIQTYREYLISKSLTLVDANTSSDVLKNILLHRMFPHYKKPFQFAANQMFEGSPEINFTGENKIIDGKSLYILNKNTNEEAEALRTACVAALDKPKDSDTDSNIYKLKAWCTVPTIKDVLIRHKFEIPKNDDQWKEILKSEWITNSSHHNQQSFFTSEELAKLNDSEDESIKIKTLKDKCNVSLNKAFTRTNFPAPQTFLKANADEFQETALFCTIPVTAENYVKKAMQGDAYESVPKDMENDFCHEEGKDISYYKNIKTTDPMAGKSFWCAVRMIYHKQTPKP